MSEHTNPPAADDDPADLTDLAELDQGGELLPFPAPAPAADAGPAGPVETPTAETDEGDDGEPVVYVDPPELPAAKLAEMLGPVWERETDRRPILPAWVTDEATRRAAVRWAWEHSTHTAGFHAVRVPVYGARLAARSPRGLGKTLAALARWTFDAESAGLRRDSNWRGEPREFVKLLMRRDERVRGRLAALAFGVLFLLLAAAVLRFAAPGWMQFAAVCGTVGVLGLAGRRPDRPLVTGPAVSTATVAPRLTGEIVVEALGSLGKAGINKALAKGGGGIRFSAPITRDGPGWRADIILPPGVTVSDVAENRDRLASGLRRPLGCVWPEPSTEGHAGQMVLWVGDRDLAKTPPPPWPLTATGTVDLFRPIPFGTDPRGRTVTMTLFEANVLIGSLPGAGKTGAARVLGLAAALDPTAQLDVFELKGSGDLSALEKVAHTYGSGMDDATIGRCLELLRELRADVKRRAGVLAGIPKEMRPDGKVTRALANRRRLGLHIRVALIDEAQNLFSHPEFGKEAGELATEVIKLGRALGVVLILATQRPDKESLPTGVSSNVGIRFCLRVMGQTENDMILGTSMYQNGVRASTLRPSDRGIGYLVGVADDPLVVRGAYLTLPVSDRIADRARAARIAAGTLTGHAIGEAAPVTTPAASILDDILAVVPAGEGKVWSESVCERLAELRPGTYDGWGAEQLAAALKPLGIETGQIGRRNDAGKTVNRRGIDRTHIAAAVAERDRRRAAG